MLFFFFFFNDTATTEIYTLSLHDALPIFVGKLTDGLQERQALDVTHRPSDLGDDNVHAVRPGDRKSTRLNSSHLVISYAVFCLKKKKNTSNTNSSMSATSISLSIQGAILP